MYRMLISATVLLTVLGASRADVDQAGIRDQVSSSPIPKVWLGIRVSSVPEALAAHLSKGELMIVNIAENSPADKAGLDRYDVILSFNGRDIETMDELLEAIADNGVDKTARIEVIKGGSEQIITLKPIKRVPAFKPAFKYEEHEVAEVNPLEDYFGHRLRLGPDGNLIVIPQGRLDQIPDDIKIMIDKLPDADRFPRSNIWTTPDDIQFDFKIDLGDLDKYDIFLDGDKNEDVTLTIRYEDDDRSVLIRRDQGGVFTVEREDDEGTKTTVVYDDLDQFRRGDPDAYKLYRRTRNQSSISTLVFPPAWNKLDDQQQQFQRQLKLQLEKAQDQYDRAMRDTRRKYEVPRTGRDQADGNKTVTISITGKGNIHITILEDGRTKEYEFDSKEDFRKTEPRLYDEYKEYLLDEQSGACDENQVSVSTC